MSFNQPVSKPLSFLSQVETYKQLLETCQKDIEHCISKKSVSGLPKLLEKLKLRDGLGNRSGSDVSDGVFDEDSTSLRKELDQCKADLLNDEKIFADQQIDFEQVKICSFAKLLSKVHYNAPSQTYYITFLTPSD